MPLYKAWLRLTCSLAFLLAIGACYSSDGDEVRSSKVESGSSQRSLDEDEPHGDLVVFAAASLTDAFEAMEDDFEAKYPRVNIKLSFGGSQSLRTQIENGARAQVFASANAAHMDALRDQDLIEAPQTFAHNELVIIVPNDNPAGIDSFATLPLAKRLVLADESVPAGAYAREVLNKATGSLGSDFPKRVDSRVVSRESHVRQTLHKVVLGEADAAIVYATDAASAKSEIKTIAIPAEFNVRASYPIAVLRNAKRSHLAKLFVEYAISEDGQAQLAKHGFQPLSAGAAP